MHEEMLTYGLKKGTKDVLLHIDSVPNGSKCGCVCPNCKADLVAKNGGDETLPGHKTHHFAHANGSEECGKGRMTALHIMAQNILKERKTILLPPYKTNYVNEEAQTKIFKEVLLEEFCKVEDIALRPDCNCISKNPEAPTLWVEIYCRHKVDDLKRTEIIHRKQYCIEVDFSDLLNEVYTIKDVIKRLESDSSHKEWICCPVWDDENKRIINQAQEERERELRQAKEEKEHYEYIRQLANEWYDQPNQMIADEITKEIKRDPYTDIDAHKQGMYECLIPSSAWASEYIKFPRNIYGLQVFNCLIHYYYQKIRLDDRSHKRWKVLDTPMWTLIKKQGERNAEEKILLEFMIVLWALNLLNNHRRYSDHDSELAKIFSYKYNVRKGLIDIMSRGGDRSLFLEKKVREKIRQEYSGKEDGETIMQVFEVCFPTKLYKDTILNSQSTHNPQPLISPESERGPQYSMSIQEAVAAVNKAFEEQEKERKRKVEDLEE